MTIASVKDEMAKRPSRMLQMAVTPMEMSNISTQLPLDIAMSHMLHYDPKEEMLHYGVEVRDLVEGTDRAVKRRRVPEALSLLQAHLELAERGVDVFAFVDRKSEAVWRFSASLRRNDDRVSKTLLDAGVEDVDDFFITAAQRK